MRLSTCKPDGKTKPSRSLQGVTMKLIKVFAAVCLLGSAFCSCKTLDSKEKPSKTEPKKVEKPETVTFPSKDGIPVTADLYMAYGRDAPLILLCHRANWSRGEYLEIAPKLNLLGFNAIAIDQRSGKTKNEIDNATKLAAEAAGKGTTYLDAVQDIQSAIEYASKLSKRKIILWGSSYSSSLGFVLAKSNQDKIAAYLAFSPGEYFTDLGKPADWVASEAKDLKVPSFVTSRPSERKDAKPIFDAIENKDKTYFVPETDSKHGSQALYEATVGNEASWKAVEAFLGRFSE